MVEDIITALSRIRWLFVIARNSSFTYKGRAVDVKQVGPRARRALRARRQRAQGGEPRAHHRAAHRCDDRRPSLGGALRGHLDDIFDLQDQVTASVVGAIAPQLEQAEIERAKRKPTESLDAYDYYLRGMAHFHHGTRQGIDEALPLFYKAIELDPRFRVGLRHGGVVPFLAQAQRLDDRSRRGRSPKARDWPAAPCELGKDDAVALTRGGHALAHSRRRPRWRHRAGRQGAGAQSQPGGGLVPRRLPENLARRAGRGDRALRPRHASQPAGFGDVSNADRNGAWRICSPRRFDAAASWAEKAFRRVARPSCRGRAFIAASHALAGRMDEARQRDAASAPLDPAMRLSNVEDWVPLRRPEDLATVVDGLRRAGLPE